MARVLRWIVVLGAVLSGLGVAAEALAVGRRAGSGSTSAEAGAKAARCPIVLETPFHAADPGLLGKYDIIDDLGDKVCDTVSIERLKVRARSAEASMKIDLSATVRARRGHDKVVRIKLELLAGDTVLGEALIKKIKVEEKDTGSGSTSMTVPAGAMPKEGTATLRLTMDDEDD